MERSTSRFLGGVFAFLALFMVLSTETRVLGAEEAHPHEHDMQQMRMPERGPGSPVPAGAVRQDAGSEMFNKLTERLDHEITQAGGQLGGFTSASQAHAKSQGIPLQISNEESVNQGGRCPNNVPVKTFDISAINAEITISRFMDFYPGYLYVLTEDVEKVRAEEKKNKAARESKEPFPASAVSTGLQGDQIQPLVVRANAGDCVRITLRNKTENDEPVSLHIHGSSMIVKATGQAATMSNKDSLVAPGKSQEFEWYIPGDQPDSSHHFHSHAVRDQWSLGMFGALVVEPRGSRYLSPWTGKEMKSGWMAMIEDPNGPDFREFAIFYHEIGDEVFRILDRNGEMLPQRDAFTDTYRPGGRALNLRSEPHGTRLAMQDKAHGVHDESMGYGSYTFGDPATTVPRSYLGDPTKYRMMGGSEVIHSHHLHGGSDRWPRSPGAVTKAEFNFAATSSGTGPVKFPPVRTSSERLDVQAIGAAESYDQVIECGSGGCAYGAGDYTFHCHIPQHYVTGMWGFWRVYNTLQASGAQDDIMPPLAELPDRKGKMKPAVDSSKLVGTTVDWFGGQKFKITADKTDWKANPPEVSVKEWVDMLLPAQGKPGGTDDEHKQIVAMDATVLDWSWQGNTALSEPETTQAWVNYKSPIPGKRFPIRFDPATGKLSIPYLRPHMGKRVPFSPEHNPAPFFEPIRRIASETEPATPGEQGPWSLCPGRAPRKYYTINGITLPITLKKATKKTPAIVDPDGLLFVLEEEEADVRKNDDRKVPLAIRANVYDCVDVIYKSKMRDDDRSVHSNKTNIHPHFFQFDITASDGVIIGFNYEQSVRPFTILKAEDKTKPHEGLPVPQNTTLTKEGKKGDTSIEIASNVRNIDVHGGKFDAPMFQPGITIGLSLDGVGEFEAVKIKEIKGNTVVLSEPLKGNHKKGAIASPEFVRYRWYPDVDLGLVFWHDHVFGLDGWGHGLFGSTIVEPAGSTYHDPVTGKEIRSGIVADIHTTDPVSTQVSGSFREVVMQIMDSNPRAAELITADNPMVGRPSVDGTPSAKYPERLNKSAMTFLNGGEATTGGGYGLRVEPLSVRLANNPDPSQLFSSKIHGDPETPMMRAYLGDPMVFRIIQGSTNEAHTWHVSGHYFPMERFNGDALPRNTFHIAIAERLDMVIPAAGGPQKMAGDYLYYSGRASHFSGGAWGMIRVLDKADKTLQPLPSREEIPASAKDLCPADAPVKNFSVSAIDYAMRFNPGMPEVMEVDLGRKVSTANESGKVYVLDDEVTKVKSGGLKPMPLTLRVNVGDCIKIKLTNRMAKERAGLHADMLAFDPKDSYGANVGNNPGDQTVAPGQSRTYTYYAHPEYGENAAIIQDWGNVVDNPRNGLYGAILIGPRGSKYRDPISGEDITLKNSWQADVIVDRTVPGNENKINYREFSLMFQDEDNLMGTSFMPYAQKVAGLTGVNYRSEPKDWYLENGCEVGMIFRCVSDNKSGPTTPTLQAHAGDPVMLHVFGGFNEQVGVFALDGHEWAVDRFRGAHLHSSFEFGGTSYLRIDLRGGAGGPHQLPGDYVYMNHRAAYTDAGQFGFLRVLPKGDKRIIALSPTDPGFRFADQGEARPVAMEQAVK
ncbi:MAG: multicopper oxidase domain-containing protein [Nitrospirae bacterium]|nr:multicopper oxidase domain-containing protein [Candidatus Manganitrophaceae bacterium]